MTDKKTRDILAQLYWRAFYDGRVTEKKGNIDWGDANAAIESCALQLGCKPLRTKKSESSYKTTVTK